MEMKKRHNIALLLCIAALLLSAMPAGAVFKEKDLPQTLSVLKFELRNTYRELEKTALDASYTEKSQHRKLVELIENCNELSIMLFSQHQDFTFDLTYALNQVTKQYLDFNKSRTPYVDIVSGFEIDIDRYEKLVHTLKNLPPAIKRNSTKVVRLPQDDSLSTRNDSLLFTPSFMEEETNPYMLDGEAKADRDSCLHYAQKILDLYWETLFRIDEDSRYYSETDRHLKEAYDYAQERYRLVQKKIFIDGQDNYAGILLNFRNNISDARKDCKEKYGLDSHKEEIVSDWRGPMVIGFIAAMLVDIVLAVILSVLLVNLLLRHVRYFRREYFRAHKRTMVLLLIVLIFSLSVMVAGVSSGSNFIKMAAPLLAEFAWLMAAVFISILIRVRGEESRTVLKVYFPILTTGFLIISFRIIFIPNSLINIIFPPMLILFAIWQSGVARRNGAWIPESDRAYTWATFGVLALTAVTAVSGYVMLALVVTIWWIFQLTVLQSISAVNCLLERYYEAHYPARMERYRARNPRLPLSHKGSFIQVTWAHDMVKMAVAPIAMIWSLPVCIFMAGSVFDLSNICMEYFNKPIISIEKVIDFSAFKIIVVGTLYYIFRYISYAAKSLFRQWKTHSAMKNLGENIELKETDLNFTLSDNVISLLCWGLFFIISFIMLKIPTSAITIVTTGLATGIGFAMRDVLNNFFYGIQLMSGRLRVGDVIECDGIRGTVESMSYQSTQITSTDGAVIAFPNSSLFSKNFKNLTRNHSYELLQIPVGVKYGTDVEKVRRLLTEALAVLQVKDQYGRDIVDPTKGVTVRFSGFGDNSVDLVVSQYTTVDTHYSYAAKAKEIIYNTLNENGIEIPFPQRDVYVRQLARQEEE